MALVLWLVSPVHVAPWLVQEHWCVPGMAVIGLLPLPLVVEVVGMYVPVLREEGAGLFGPGLREEGALLPGLC